MVNNARDAIQVATQVIEEAGYVTFRVTDVEEDEDEGQWTVTATSGQTEIVVTINEDGEVEGFTTS